MKMLLPNTSGTVVNDVFLGAVGAINFARSAEGNYKALVPLKLPNSGAAGDTRTFIATVPITFTGERTVSSKNRTRVLLKVSLPYTAISPDVADDAVVANQFDSRRSGGEVTAHIVLSVPASMAQDFAGDSGSTCQRGAIAQMRVVMQLLGCLISGDAAPVVAALNNSVSGKWSLEGIETYSLSEANSGLGSLVPLDEGEATGFKGYISSFSHHGVTGIDASELVNHDIDLREPLVRGLMKSTPLTDEGVASGRVQPLITL